MKNNLAKTNNDLPQINQNKNWNSFQPDPIFQPDLIGPYTRNEQTRQSRQLFRQDKTQHHTTIIFTNNKIQKLRKVINQHKCETKYRFEITIYKNTTYKLFSRVNAAESLQMTMKPYLMGGSSLSSRKPLMVFKGTDPEYSVEDYLNAVTANFISNIGPEPVNTPLHENWIQRRTSLI